MNEKIKPDNIDAIEIKMLSVDAVDFNSKQVAELGTFNPIFMSTELNNTTSAIFHQDTISEMVEFTETYEYMVDNNILYMKVNL